MLRPARQKKRTHGAPGARRHYPIAKAADAVRPPVATSRRYGGASGSKGQRAKKEAAAETSVPPQPVICPAAAAAVLSALYFRYRASICLLPVIVPVAPS